MNRALKSMTGFGRASADVGDRRLRVEIRAVNHRGLDLKIRSPEPDAFCEAEIARAVRATVERGAIMVHIRDESRAGSAGIDEDRVRAVHGVLERLRQELEIDEPVNLATVGAFMGAAPADSLAGEALWEMLRPAIVAALADLSASRTREGAALAADLEAHRHRLGEIRAELAQRAAGLPERFTRRLDERLAALRGQPGFEPARVAQEAALMAERLDVSEELVRLETHLGHFAEMLRDGGSIGRKLDFVIQELGRELNTIGSKAQDAPISALVINGKAELEKLREQVQNVE